MIEECRLCARNCSVNRNSNKVGYCKATDKVKVALVSTHYYEEPCISRNKWLTEPYFFLTAI